MADWKNRCPRRVAVVSWYVQARDHPMKEPTVNTWTATQTRLQPALCVATRQHRLQAAWQHIELLELDRDAGRCRG